MILAVGHSHPHNNKGVFEGKDLDKRSKVRVKVSHVVETDRGRGKHYINESPHKDRSNRLTVCAYIKLHSLKMGNNSPFLCGHFGFVHCVVFTTSAFHFVYKGKKIKISKTGTHKHSLKFEERQH